MTPKDTISKTSQSSIQNRFCTICLGIFCLMAAPWISPSHGAEVVDRIVAVVNDDIVVLQEIDEQMKPFLLKIQTSGYSEEQMRSQIYELRKGIISELINQKLINQAALEYEWLEVSKEDIDAYVERIKQSNEWTDAQLDEAIDSQGLSMETFRKQLKEEMLRSRLVNQEVQSRIVVTKADVTEYYNQHKDEYRGETTYHLRNILIKTPQTGDASAKETVDNKIAEIYQAFEAGKPFEKLAATYSESPFASEGGELGKFRLKDLSPNLRAAVEPLSPGEVTQPQETSDGYQILFLQEIQQQPGTPIESVYGEIEEKLYQEQYQEKMQAWTESLRENAHIRIIE